MDISQLKMRRMDLIEERCRLEELMDAGHDCELELLQIEEEIASINVTLRDIGVTRTKDRPRLAQKTNAEFTFDKQQYADWLKSMADDDEGEKAEMRRIAMGSMAVMTRRQREIWDLWQSGMNKMQIARKLGVHRADVFTVIDYAKRAMQVESERIRSEQLFGRGLADLADPEIAVRVLGALTCRQAVYFFLYYSEWMLPLDIANLLNLKRESVGTGVQNASRNLGVLTGYKECLLDNVDALDDLAYQTYCKLLLDEGKKPWEIKPVQTVPVMRYTHPRLRPSQDLYPPITVRISSGRTECMRDTTWGRWPFMHRQGKLVTAIKAEAGDNPDFSINRRLQEVFEPLTGRNFQHDSAKWWRIHMMRQGKTFANSDASKRLIGRKPPDVDVKNKEEIL